jgi:endo-1,4-beta-xylanase
MIRVRTKRARAAIAVVGVLGILVAGIAAVGLGPASAAPLADSASIEVGVAVNTGLLGNATYADILRDEFDVLVAENVWKWDATEPSQGNFTFSSGDQFYDFALANQKTIYGHTLVWHSQLPSWVSQINDGPELLSAMDNHITTLMERYPATAYWDVANEIIEGDGQWRNSVFFQVLGEDYVRQALQMARAADPDAKLCLNDYSIDGINTKSTAYYNLIQDLQSEGIPIDCMGFQAHLIVGQVPSTMQQNLQRFADLGVEVRITELDIRMNVPSSAADRAQQEQDYAQVADICEAVNGCGGITLWGVSDADSWIPDVFGGQGEANLWDGSYQRKPVYYAFDQALGGDPQPTTTTTSTTTSTSTTGPTTTIPSPQGCSAELSIVNSWDSGYEGQVTVTAGSGGVTSWTVEFSIGSSTLAGSWNADIDGTTGTITASDVGWNGTLGAGQSASFGFQGNGSPAAAGPISCNGVGPTATTTTAPPTTTTTAPPTTTTAPSPTTTGPSGSCSATVEIVNSWSGAYQAEVTVSAGSQPVNGWIVGLDLGSSTLQASWNAEIDGTTGAITATGVTWNSSIPAGGSVSFGIQGTGTPPSFSPTCS